MPKKKINTRKNSSKNREPFDQEKVTNIIGHEMRNIFANITNAVYLLKLELPTVLSAKPESKFPRHVQILENAVKSMDNIIHNMLDYSRKRQPVFFREDLNAIINGILEKTLIPENITLKLELNEIPKVSFDPEEITQAIKNLISNALDSMFDKKEGHLTIKTKKTDDGKFVSLEVEDTGCGIDAGDIDKVLEPFFSGKSKGVGLGLTVARRVVEDRHKGKLKISSQLDKGTKIQIQLPVEQ
ncbi:MAG: HAMP domain-containing histidine kinase [Endomicrobiales bacterium]|nr:HAMP domain-containing histidine kinase [Endomicrobiales bacterium]